MYTEDLTGANTSTLITQWDPPTVVTALSMAGKFSAGHLPHTYYICWRVGVPRVNLLKLV